MLSTTRRLIALTIGAAGGLLLWSVSPEAHGQVKIGVRSTGIAGVGEGKTFTDAVTVPTNRESKRLIRAAQDYIKKKEWGTATECLQTLLEDKEDSFIEVGGGPDDKGKPTKRRISVRTEANRLIGELPADGLETYQVKYGQTAADHLKAALEANDPALLAEVAVRYLHTKAGAEATNLLGTYHLDRGSYLMANLSFERLLSRPDADKLPAKVLFKAALAARRAGDLATAEKWWQKMTAKAGRGDLVFGTRRVSLGQARAEFERSVAQASVFGQSDWALFRGNPARNAQGVGGTAYLEPRWQYDMASIDDSSADHETVDVNKQIRALHPKGPHSPGRETDSADVLPDYGERAAPDPVLRRRPRHHHEDRRHGRRPGPGWDGSVGVPCRRRPMDRLRIRPATPSD